MFIAFHMKRILFNLYVDSLALFERSVSDTTLRYWGDIFFSCRSCSQKMSKIKEAVNCSKCSLLWAERIFILPNQSKIKQYLYDELTQHMYCVYNSIADIA